MAGGVALFVLAVLGLIANVAPAENVRTEETEDVAMSGGISSSQQAAGPDQANTRNSGPASAPEMSVEKRVLVGATALQSVVRVSAKTCDGYLVGSGFVVGGNVITNRHLVEGSGQAKVDTGEVLAFADVLSPRDPIDLAVLDGLQVRLPELALAAQDPGIGEAVLFAGHAGGGPIKLQTGAVHTYVDGDAYGISGPLMLIDAPSEPGFSGGPVLNGNGEVVAVLQGFDLVTELTLAIPVTSLSAWLVDVSLVPFEASEGMVFGSNNGECL